jgi:hypothetical protein
MFLTKNGQKIDLMEKVRMFCENNIESLFDNSIMNTPTLRKSNSVTFRNKKMEDYLD